VLPGAQARRTLGLWQEGIPRPAGPRDGEGTSVLSALCQPSSYESGIQEICNDDPFVRGRLPTAGDGL